MIRTLMAVVLAVLIVGFVWSYAFFTNQIKPVPTQVAEWDADGSYDINVVSTFDVQGNRFGFPAIKVAFRDQVLLESNALIAAGVPVTIENVADIKKGLNDFLVQVTPVETSSQSSGGAFSLEASTQTPQSEIARAFRVSILRDGYEIAHEVVWADQKGPISELVRINVIDYEPPYD